MNEHPTIFVSINSTDKLINKLKRQIEKLCHIELWVMKSLALLDKYLSTLDKLDQETDKVEMGHLIQDSEVYYMSCITTYLRCFLNQNSLHLKIKDVTSEKELRDCYFDLMSLRNDEYVHWKGVNSQLSVTYSFKAVDLKTIELAKDINISFQQSFGPKENTDLIKQLFQETIKHIKKKRDSAITKVREHLKSPEVFSNSELLNQNGDSVIKKQ